MPVRLSPEREMYRLIWKKRPEWQKLVIDSQLFDLDNMGVEDGYHTLFNRWDYSSSKEIMLWKKFDRSLDFGTMITVIPDVMVPV